MQANTGEEENKIKSERYGQFREAMNTLQNNLVQSGDGGSLKNPPDVVLRGELRVLLGPLPGDTDGVLRLRSLLLSRRLEFTFS
mmetsp:Transcript_13161/g.18965  ORF Transcript_13161/g.18965 Transcript_13161/m.18965 type:complete len:84 (-) Transcript_13161:1837-2088(-)